MDPKPRQVPSAPPNAEDASQKPVADIVTDQAAVLQEEAKAQSRAALDKLQAEAETTFDKSRREIAEQISTVSRALRGGGKELREHHLASFAVYPEQMAERVEDVSAYLRERDKDAMRRDFESSLERDPVLVLGGLAALGAAGMWYLKRRQRTLAKPNKARPTGSSTNITTPTSQNRGL